MNEKPELFLYNTMTRKKEPFKPLSGDEARVYSCGPTVYDTAHIGNMRAYLFIDSLRRVLKRGGFKLKHVMNITDVGHLVSDRDTGEDKMIKGAREQNKTPWEIAAHYTKLFMDDTAALGVDLPDIIEKATDHIPQMLEIIKALMEKGYAYELSDGIYFDISKFVGYGNLSRLDLDEQIAGARVDVNPDKRHPADFALWIKAPAEHIMQWESPWGAGYPGWHIECSAISMHYLGDQIDIHTGGVDHIPIHHENEIAQSDAFVGKRVVNIWMHNEFLLIDNGKMSKSLRNNYTIADIRVKGYNPLEYRYFCLNGHYRNKLNFTWEGMHSASVSYRRFIEGALAHRVAPENETAATSGGGRAGGWNATTGVSGNGTGNGATSLDPSYLEGMSESFEAAIYDDLNMPKALGIAWQLVRNPVKSKKIYNLLLDMDEVLGLGLKAAGEEKAGGFGGLSGAAGGASGDIPYEISELARERDAARAAKDWKRSDELRELIKEKGYAISDSKQGAKIEKLPQ